MKLAAAMALLLLIGMVTGYYPPQCETVEH